jgi:uncharacterized cupin superfamily protein
LVLPLVMVGITLASARPARRCAVAAARRRTRSRRHVDHRHRIAGRPILAGAHRVEDGGADVAGQRASSSSVWNCTPGLTSFGW